MLVIEKMKYGIEDIIKALAVKPSPSPAVDGFADISTDSRTVKPGELFFALKGENFDGHQFVGQAIEKGASGVVVTDDTVSENAVVFKVKDTLKALGDLAALFRSRYDIKCAGITGSNGKTTTKEMLGACMQVKYDTFTSIGNFNNLIGVPLSIFRLNEAHEAAVFELGMSAPGEIFRLAEICKPQVGIFTNVAPAHLETMGTIDAIASAKHELIEKLPDNGTAVINADDSRLSSWISDIKQKVITYSIENDADFRVIDISANADGTSSFKINGSEFNINLPGRHNIYNAACAIAASSAFGIDATELVEILPKIKPYNLRSEMLSVNGINIINDCYNANPESMKAAIDILANSPSSSRLIAVLGDMLELGEMEIEYHEIIGQYLQSKKIDALFAAGELAANYLNKFNGSFKEHFEDKEHLAEALIGYLKPGDTVLIKGSRGIAMEEITEKLMENS
jgi:UDP-N-acetylmuramoyl-tripeptide--D-alanyl-D-alanine ligase